MLVPNMPQLLEAGGGCCSHWMILAERHTNVIQIGHGEKYRQQSQNVHGQWLQKRENKMQNADQRKGGDFTVELKRGEEVWAGRDAAGEERVLGKSRSSKF